MISPQHAGRSPALLRRRSRWRESHDSLLIFIIDLIDDDQNSID